MYDRIIDLGCGDASYATALLPPTTAYIGIDRVRQMWSASSPISKMTFLQGDALCCLSKLEPTSNDLIFSLFAAHHIGIEELGTAILDCSAEVLIIEPVKAHPTSANVYVAFSVLLSRNALFWARGKRSNLMPFLNHQLKFFRNPTSCSHIAEDIKQDRLHNVSGRVGLSKLRFGSMNIYHRGDRIAEWLAF